MKNIKIINKEAFLQVLNLNYKENSEYTFYIQTWQDGDSFLDVCDNDEGIKSEQLLLFKEKNKNYIFKLKKELFEFTKRYIENKSFTSKNEVYKLGYEIYIICKNEYFVFCPELNKGYYTKLNFINRLIGFFYYSEPWQNEKFNYWEKQKKSE